MSLYNDSFRMRYKSLPIAISESHAHFDTKPHIHSEIELLSVKQGKARISVGDKCYSVDAGELVIVNPMEVHSIICDREIPYYQRCICFDLSFLPDKNLVDDLCMGRCFVEHYFPKESTVTSGISEYFDKMLDSVNKSDDTLIFDGTAYASLIFSELKRNGLIVRKNSSGKRTDFVFEVKEYLSKHFAESISSENVASELYYTQSYFCRLFRKNFGTSFWKYLLMYRISKAKALIEDDTLKISEIAEKVGITDQSYFSKCFKQLVGVSPMQYKKCQCNST